MFSSGYAQFTEVDAEGVECTIMGDPVLSVWAAGAFTATVKLWEWVPGVEGWVERAAITSAGHTDYKASKTMPTRWKLTCSAFTSGNPHAYLR